MADARGAAVECRDGHEEERRKTAVEKISQALEANASRLPTHLQALADPSKRQLEGMSGGLVNYVVKASLKDQPGCSVVAKQAPPFFKCLGPDYPLGVRRSLLEYKALLRFHEAVPGSVPHPYFYDKDHDVLCMEYLDGYQMLRSELMAGHLHESACVNLTRELGRLHHVNHVGTLGADVIKQLDQESENKELVDLQYQYVFTRPYVRNDVTNRWLPEVTQRREQLLSDSDVTDAAKALVKIYLEKKESLLHGDLHTGSVMVKGDDAKMMDLEFAFVGPCAYDLGTLVANFIFSYYYHMAAEDPSGSSHDLAYRVVDIAHHAVAAYLEEMKATVGDRDAYVKNLMSEVAGFAGCRIISRILGTAHAEEMERNPSAALECLGAGQRLMHAYRRIESIGRLMIIALMLIT